MRARSLIQVGARERLALIDSILAQRYQTPEASLGNKKNPLNEAIYIVLSFQTDVPRLKKTWAALRRRYSDWEALERAPLNQVASVIRDGGLQHQKAKTLKLLLAKVREVTGRLSLDPLKSLPDTAAQELLTRLPGLSWKAARCVLLYSLDRQVFPVDGNTFRILKRTGVLHANAVYRRRSLHDGLETAVPQDRRRALHVNLVVHGQRTCLSRAPRCSECPLRPTCAMNGLSPIAKHECRT